MCDCVKFNIFLLTFVVSIGIIIKCRPLIEFTQSAILNFTEITTINHYFSDEHTVVTEDGYVLTIFRILKARNCHHEKKQIPVLVMHGLLQNSDAFLDAGPSAGLAYLISDSCYDVWFGNTRGNNYGRKHIILNPNKDAKFWQFSDDDVGYYDIPAIIDYILEHTGANKVNYVGFSQGGGTFLVMCSERPQYCSKIGVMIGLAPGLTGNHSESLLVKLIFRFMLLFKRCFDYVGIYEVFSKGAFFQQSINYLCQMPEWSKMLCATGGFSDNYRPDSIAPNTQKLIFNHLLMGTSLKTFVRYAQINVNGKFQKFDYGEKINLYRYNSTHPPEYNLKAVSAPVVIIQGKSDKIISIHDARLLSRELPNLLEMVEISDPKWTHFDMIYAKDIKTILYPKINEYLEMFSKNLSIRNK